MLASQSQDKIEQFDHRTFKTSMPDFARLLFLIVGSHFFESNITSVVCVCIAIRPCKSMYVRSKDSESQSGASPESPSLKSEERRNCQTFGDIWRHLLKIAKRIWQGNMGKSGNTSKTMAAMAALVPGPFSVVFRLRSVPKVVWSFAKLGHRDNATLQGPSKSQRVAAGNDGDGRNHVVPLRQKKSSGFLPLQLPKKRSIHEQFMHRSCPFACINRISSSVAVLQQWDFDLNGRT